MFINDSIKSQGLAVLIVILLEKNVGRIVYFFALRRGFSNAMSCYMELK